MKNFLGMFVDALALKGFWSILQRLGVLKFPPFSISNLVFATTCDKWTGWIAVISSAVGYIGLIQKHKMNKINAFWKILLAHRDLEKLFSLMINNGWNFFKWSNLNFPKHFLAIYNTMMQSIADIELIHGTELEQIDNLPTDGTKYLLILINSMVILSKLEKLDSR